MTPDEIRQIEGLVNLWIQEDHSLSTTVVPLAEAKAKGDLQLPAWTRSVLPASQACSRGSQLPERALLTWCGIWPARLVCEAHRFTFKLVTMQ